MLSFSTQLSKRSHSTSFANPQNKPLQNQNEQLTQQGKIESPQNSFRVQGPIKFVRFFYINKLQAHYISTNKQASSRTLSFIEQTPSPKVFTKGQQPSTEGSIKLLYEQIRELDPLKNSKIIENLRHIRSQKNINCASSRTTIDRWGQNNESHRNSLESSVVISQFNN